MKEYSIMIPATSANLGAGFDSIGMAIDLFNKLRVREIDRGYSSLKCSGYGSDLIDSNDNLVLKAYHLAFESKGLKVPAVEMFAENSIPFSRGLGSSSAAVVAGLVAAQAMSGNLFTKEEIVQLATKLDGHPDNVLPALFGGFVLGAIMDTGEVIYKKISVISNLKAYAFIPDFSLSTELARNVLPSEIKRCDVVSNISHYGLFAVALITQDLNLFKNVLTDRIHERYRYQLMKGMHSIKSKIAQIDGTLGTVISGAGSTILVFSKTDIDLCVLEEIMFDENISGKVLEVSPINDGVKLFEKEKELAIWH